MHQQGYTLDIGVKEDVQDSFFQALVEMANIQKTQKEEECGDRIKKWIHDLNPQAQMQLDGQLKIVFNKTRIIYEQTERSLFQREFPVKQITPLSEAPGILFVTNERIYYQPHHSLSGKKVVQLTINQLTQFFKRRYKLADGGLELATEDEAYYFLFELEDDMNAVYFSVQGLLPSSCKTEDTPVLELTK